MARCSLLKIYSKQLSDRETRYLIFDVEYSIPYIYNTNKLLPIRLYMESEIDCDITIDTLDRYVKKYEYKEISRENCNTSIFKTHIKNMIEKSYIFCNYNTQLFSMCRKANTFITMI